MKKILVVDDSMVMRSVLKSILENNGYQVALAMDGKEALALMDQVEFDLITLDIEMPKMNGFEFCETLRKQEDDLCQRSAIPVVFVTASDSIEERMRGFEVGASDFVRKEDTDKLIDVVQQLLGQSEKALFSGSAALVVEDSRAVRIGIVQFLASEGFEVLQAGNGRDALELVREYKERLDLVVTDYAMPLMNGDELCRRIRSELKLLALPVIVISSHSDKKYVLALFRAGATDYLSKPFAKEELIARIRSHVQMHKLLQDLRETQKRLEEMSRYDELTSLANRRYFNEFMDTEWRRAIRHQLPLSLIMLDVDHFKKYNDSYGHIMGDLCLQKVGGVLRKALKRPTDLACRYGGEEFALVLPETDSAGAELVAGQVIDCLAGLDIPHTASPVAARVTASLGICSMVPLRGAEFSCLIKAADEALYAAKDSGRNRYVVGANA